MDEEVTGSPADHDDLASLSALDDPTRRRLYDHVAAAGAPVSRDTASAALGIERSLAAYHLDRLVDEGLLVTSFARPEGRGGPGAGRPAKYYARAQRELAVSVPPRDYRLAAELLARAAESDVTGTTRAAVDRVAGQLGREMATSGHGAADVVSRLRDQGFEPYDDDGVTRLRNCPFHQLAREHTELVCGMNLAMLSGLAAAAPDELEARLEPAPGRCCVALHPA
jgi:predicted ArsR family transcriptional regulator